MIKIDIWGPQKKKGKIKVISMSKTRKITASKKNLILNGIRVLLTGSKPHSNGDDFSTKLTNFQHKTKQQIRIVVNKREIKK